MKSLATLLMTLLVAQTSFASIVEKSAWKGVYSGQDQKGNQCEFDYFKTGGSWDDYNAGLLLEGIAANSKRDVVVIQRPFPSYANGDVDLSKMIFQSQIFIKPEIWQAILSGQSVSIKDENVEDRRYDNMVLKSSVDELGRPVIEITPEFPYLIEEDRKNYVDQYDRDYLASVKVTLNKDGDPLTMESTLVHYREFLGNPWNKVLKKSVCDFNK